ncbi:MAG: adenosine kinase [Planctomycetota bacterium]|nr:MAG: adenosine kinase [Planctomycetota bacterium]
MTLLVVGTVAFDTIDTPFGRRERILGGSATFFGFAASYFGELRLMSAVGGDFPSEHVDALRARGIDLTGLQVLPESKTMHWAGNYVGDMNEADTLDFEPNVLDNYTLEVPQRYRDSNYLFLATDHPDTQLQVLEAMTHDPFTVLDTRDVWIDNELDGLKRVLRKVHGLVLNDDEARRLSGERNLVRAGPELRALGPSWVVIKKGEHGSILFSEQGVTALPACPLEVVKDPTGAGDSFAGGLMGYLASTGKRSIEAVKRGMTYGTVTASIAVDDFSVDPFHKVSKQEFQARHDAFLKQIRI